MATLDAPAALWADAPTDLTTFRAYWAKIGAREVGRNEWTPGVVFTLVQDEWSAGTGPATVGVSTWPSTDAALTIAPGTVSVALSHQGYYSNLRAAMAVELWLDDAVLASTLMVPNDEPDVATVSAQIYEETTGRLRLVVVNRHASGSSAAEWTIMLTGTAVLATYAPAPPAGTPPTITTEDIGPLSVGVAVDAQLHADGDEPVTWEVVAGGVDGLTLSPAGALTGTPTTAGDYSLTVEATNVAGVDERTYAGTVDELDEPAGPWMEEAAGHVAALLDRADDEGTIELARAHVWIVAAYVDGYTRGVGFESGRPALSLLAVIVAATARLTANPEQVASYSAGDYSERPAVLAGWTPAERAVLRRYRRVTA